MGVAASHVEDWTESRAREVTGRTGVASQQRRPEFFLLTVGERGMHSQRGVPCGYSVVPDSRGAVVAGSLQLLVLDRPRSQCDRKDARWLAVKAIA